MLHEECLPLNLPQGEITSKQEPTLGCLESSLESSPRHAVIEVDDYILNLAYLIWIIVHQA